jgi:hypothetical protein
MPLPAVVSLLHQTQTKNNMKATTIIIATVLALQVNILFADNDNTSAPATGENTLISMSSLSPATPAEATFEEGFEMNEAAHLAPVIPAEATFEDMPSEMTQTVDLAPMTPAVADFEEAIDMIKEVVSVLSPVTPFEADFE